MKRLLPTLHLPTTRLIAIFVVLILVGIIRWFFDRSLTHKRGLFLLPSSSADSDGQLIRYRRQVCSCTRPLLGDGSNLMIIDETTSSLCSQYSTLRGLHQRVIAISMYGPKENVIFSTNASLYFLYGLIADMTEIYPGWVLRIYHDASIKEDIICPIECQHNHVDFCNASGLGIHGNIAQYMPPKIWRFLPAGDLSVDVMGSRDLDSPLSARELAAVNEWLATDQPWHAMRDHPLHTVPMLGGMWGFRPALNRTFSLVLLQKFLNSTLISRYGGRADQTFLSEHVWPYIENDAIVHDSHLCQRPYGKNSRPWPTRRPPLNETGCFVGCIRPCCRPLKFPFGECPLACRPKNHTDWTMC